MIARLVATLALPAMALALAACGEKPQSMSTGAKTADADPWSVSNSATAAFRAPGWKDGDKTAWEEQIRKRNQAQNDYVR